MASKRDIYAVKQRLIAYRNLERHSDELINKLRMLEAVMYSINVPELSDMPRGGASIDKDKIGKLVIRKEELEQEIGDALVEHNAEQAWVHKAIGGLPRWEERYVLTYRYIYGMSWKRLNQRIYGSRESFKERQESYMRRCTRAHWRAMERIADRIETGEL